MEKSYFGDFSDQHIPHHHQDMMAFLRAIKKEIQTYTHTEYW